MCPNRRDDGMTAGRRQILVVDDEAVIPEMISFFLGEAYEIRAATTGAEALVRVRRDRVDLVVLDHRLPDRTGLDVLTELRSIRPFLPVIMLTGYGSEWICASAFKRGVTDYLQKPMTAVELVAAALRGPSPPLAHPHPPPENPTPTDLP